MATVQTVLGPIAAEEMGFVLAHEHVMVDFIGAEETSPDRWDADEVVEVMAPYLLELVELGVRTFVDCTPAYIGRDVTVLQRLSQETGLHILSNTGWYKAPYLPARAFEQSAEEIAAEWIAEWEQGIDGTDVRPGLIKIAVNPGPLVPVQRTIVKAAALTSLTTGLTIAAHTGHGHTMASMSVPPPGMPTWSARPSRRVSTARCCFRTTPAGTASASLVVGVFDRSRRCSAT